MDLTHVLFNANLNVEMQALCEVGQGLAEHYFNIRMGAARWNAHCPVYGGVAGDTVTRLSIR